MRFYCALERLVAIWRRRCGGFLMRLEPWRNSSKLTGGRWNCIYTTITIIMRNHCCPVKRRVKTHISPRNTRREIFPCVSRETPSDNVSETVMASYLYNSQCLGEVLFHGSSVESRNLGDFQNGVAAFVKSPNVFSHQLVGGQAAVRHLFAEVEAG